MYGNITQFVAVLSLQASSVLLTSNKNKCFISFPFHAKSSENVVYG